jgi:hypothetical protein
MRSSFRAGRNSERGFALIIALVLAVLYFAFIELLMMDAAREMSEARHFRGHIVALTLAENGAELAAAQMMSVPAANVPPVTDWQGTTSGQLKKSGEQFELFGVGQASGPDGANATVHIEGIVPEGTTQIRILFARHSQ